MANPLAGRSTGHNPLLTRADLQAAVRDLCAPLRPHFSRGGARVRLSFQGGGLRGRAMETWRRSLGWAQRLPWAEARQYAQRHGRANELESFARPLWGLAPLAAGGGEFDGWALYRRGLANGTDPRHPEYWGEPRDFDQSLVEMAALGAALALAPDQVWAPLEARAKANLTRWLLSINQHQLYDNNWLFFRVLVNLGLERVGAEHDQAATHVALERLESFYLGEGWYSDGPTAQRDYYVAFAMHFYSLIYVQLTGDDDRERAQRFRERAAQFAQDFVYWFAEDGAALPFGRSLTYRFAQGSLWGALAFAGVQALPWGVLKGLSLRHLRYWSRRPIFSDDGRLSIGYGYQQLDMADQYNYPGSPYWALKCFLPLALPETHPFWQADAVPLPALEPVRPLPQPGMIICRDPGSPHVFALAAGQQALWVRHGAAKYAKFAYSTVFGFSVPANEGGLERPGDRDPSKTGEWRLAQAAADSMLALSDDGVRYRVRQEPQEARLEREGLRSIWRPWPEVEVETWLVPAGAWHLRLHRLRCGRPLWSAEGGFAVSTEGGGQQQAEAGLALARYPAGASGLRDLLGQRVGRVVATPPNTNLLAPRAMLPTLLGQHALGEHWLACAVVGIPDSQRWESVWREYPECPGWFRELMGKEPQSLYADNADRDEFSKS